jgi:hypothetical protein
MEPSSKRRHPPKYSQIAHAVGTTMRQVSRWSAGDTRPLRVYENVLATLPLRPSDRPSPEEN